MAEMLQRQMVIGRKRCIGDEGRQAGEYPAGCRNGVDACQELFEREPPELLVEDVDRQDDCDGADEWPEEFPEPLHPALPLVFSVSPPEQQVSFAIRPEAILT